MEWLRMFPGEVSIIETIRLLMHNQKKAYMYGLATVLLWSTVASAWLWPWVAP
jgi:hypothetical protein